MMVRTEECQHDLANVLRSGHSKSNDANSRVLANVAVTRVSSPANTNSSNASHVPSAAVDLCFLLSPYH